MSLIPEGKLAEIPEIGSDEGIEFEDKVVCLRLFDRESEWCWYVLEFDREDTCLGFIVNKSGVVVGEFTLSELAGLRSSTGISAQSVVRDEDFQPMSVADLCAVDAQLRAGLREAIRTSVDLVQLD